MGFKGRASGVVHNIEPIWSNTRQLGSLSVAVGEMKGTKSGTGFDMLSSISDPFPANLKSIKVRSGDRIDALECMFTLASGGEFSTGRMGGGGGKEQIFTLNDNERIIRIEGRSGSQIDRLQFFTNQNRTFVPASDLTFPNNFLLLLFPIPTLFPPFWSDSFTQY